MKVKHGLPASCAETESLVLWGDCCQMPICLLNLFIFLNDKKAKCLALLGKLVSSLRWVIIARQNPISISLSSYSIGYSRIYGESIILKATSAIRESSSRSEDSASYLIDLSTLNSSIENKSIKGCITISINLKPTHSIIIDSLMESWGKRQHARAIPSSLSCRITSFSSDNALYSLRTLNF